jgi:hypothetical protein
LIISYLCVFSISFNCVCVDEVQKLGKAMKKVKDGDVLVVGEEFIDDVSKESGNVNQLIKKHKISSWGPDVSVMHDQCFYNFTDLGNIS